MRASEFFIATLREPPADAEIISHQLMLRAGLIRKLASGLYTWLPLGLRVLRKVETIVREEMNRSGALEVLMPVVQPSELWQESGRWQQYGSELLRIKDRHQRDFCLGPTHEEVITDLVRSNIQSYKQLPINLYQIQTKFRDETRPRFGVMRAREFLMKDGYSFHLDQSSLAETYDHMYDAYHRIFTRIGLEFRAVLADTGSIGGSRSHEFHVLADSGEDAIAISNGSDFAANVELAEALPPAMDRAEPAEQLRPLATPDVKTIEQVCNHLGVSADKVIKTLIVRGNGDPGKVTLVALAIRGDHTLNEIKAEKLPMVSHPLTLATDEEIVAAIGCRPGSIGPVGLSIPVIADHAALALTDFVCGANRDDHHLAGVNWGRDCPEPQGADIRNVNEGDPSPDGAGSLIIRRGIEVGHIFQLGTKYSEAMRCTVLTDAGRPLTVTMGCYGIGVSRVVAAAIEQHHDQKGIVWPEAIAPFRLVIVPMNAHKSPRVREAAEELYQQLTERGVDVLLDDRNERPGVKFADLELMGIPHRVVLGEKALDQGAVEYQSRLDGETHLISVADLLNRLGVGI